MNEKSNTQNFFYVIDSGSDLNQHMFSDVKKMENATQLSVVFDIQNPILRFLNKVHLSTKINKIIDIPFKGIWNRWYVMNKELDNVHTKWIVVTNWSIRRFGLSYLKRISADNNVKLVLLYLDPVSLVPEFYKKYIRQIKFDLIYSFEEADCKQYGYIYSTNQYSMDDITPVETPAYDVYYIGLDKGRAELVNDIYSKLVNKGMRCNFVIVTENGKTSDNGMGLRYINQQLPYKEVLDGINNARVILEIVQGGQSGMTMRPYEAIFYNKKLLTNNAKIKEMDFFRGDYMSCFTNVDDIDMEFVRQKNAVDYNYHYQYSPISWLNKMPEDLALVENKKGNRVVL